MRSPEPDSPLASPSIRARLTLVTLLTSGLLVSGCVATAGPPPEPDPQAARDAWIAALSSGEPARVWEMMSDDARSRFESAQVFERWCRRYCSDLLVATMSGSDTPRREARVGEHTQLVWEDDAWRVERSDLVPLERTVPAALRRLARQLDGLAASPTPSRSYGQRLRRFASALRVAANQPTAHGDPKPGQALVLNPAPGARVELVWEDGWRVARWVLPDTP